MRKTEDAYARAGVLEYWIVEPWPGTIELLRLDPQQGGYEPLGIFSGSSRLPTQALRGLPASVAELLG